MNRADIFSKLGLKNTNPGAFCGEWLGSGKVLESVSPNNGRVLASVRTATPAEYERTVKAAQRAFQKWQSVPAPRRGEIVRKLGNALREAKDMRAATAKTLTICRGVVLQPRS